MSLSNIRTKLYLKVYFIGCQSLGNGYLVKYVDVTIIDMTEIDHLYRLQQIDNDIRLGKERLATIMRLQSESSELVSARERVTIAEQTLQRCRTKHNDLNLELKTLDDKSKRSENRLYSGLVKNPKELADIQHEIESLSRRRSVLEDELLEAMIDLEDAETEHETAATELVTIEERWKTEQNSLTNEKDQLLTKLGESINFRKQQLSSISKEAMVAYERTQKIAGSIAVVLLKNGRCMGCQVTVPANLAKGVDQGELINCDSCGRLLYLA